MATNDNTGYEIAFITILAAILTLAAGVWTGGQLAALAFGSHQALGVGLTDTIPVLARLPHHLSDPAVAWPWPADDRLPGAVGYWLATLPVLAALLIGTARVVVWALRRRQHAGVESRRRLGVDPEARFATADDLAPLWVNGPTPGRVILGRVDGHLVATEDRHQPLPPLPRRLRREAAARRGDRGAIVAIGPSRSGKTTALAVPAILEWEGPVIALSVKSDLMGATIERRRRLGDVKVFDPCDMTSINTCHWSPLRSSGTYSGARKAATALADAVAPDASSDNRFWNEQAQDLVAALLWTAANDGRTMNDVVRWIVTLDRPGDGRTAEPSKAIEALRSTVTGQAANDVERANQQLAGIWSYDYKQLSSVYITAKTMISRWDDDTVMKSADGPAVDLDWLLDTNAETARANTLYLCAPLRRAHHMAPVLAGLVEDLLEQAYLCHGKNDTPVGPILLVIDEAGNWPIRDLPAIAATCAAVGIQLMVIFQSKAQIDAAYGPKADTLISSCITKVFFAGISDTSSLNYGAGLLGNEHIRQRQLSYRLGAGITNRQTMSESPTQTELLPAALLRQLRAGEALLVHNTLRPAHLHGRQWFTDDALHTLAKGTPVPRPTRRWNQTLLRGRRRPDKAAS